MAAVAVLPPQDVPGEPVPELEEVPPQPVVKPPQGEELWQCVKAVVTKDPWMGSQEPDVASSLIVFDWDDTLLPTTALVAAGRIAPAAGSPGAAAASGAFGSGQLSSWEFDSFLETCAASAIQALRQASKYGKVVIITNSGFGWVHETASRFMPSILSELEQIPVISARAIFEPLGVAAPYRWKVLCFRRIVDLFSFDPEGKTGPSGLISVGDGWQERVAALMAAQDTDVGSVKCLKFLEQPGVDQLAQELDLCSQIFEGLAAHPSWVEASYSYTEAWGLQLEARAADTVALGGSFSAVEGTVEVVSDTVENTGMEAEHLEPQPEQPASASPEPAKAKAGMGQKRLRRSKSGKASLLARAGKMQALPLGQSYLSMSAQKKAAARRLWFKARKSCKARALKGNLLKRGHVAL
mmetsp:Transcript_78977/g.189637  ORF Transcript_78977/g.189637 Transcript_78977/m.189637 type:complete len:411 (-) Transcript_78977:97-1329(-)|eukprot:CAMPEP_0181466994 /NCGR_PEP_ID=MMETSP1110-20121109/36745_1 /TAXON_ID=174948 /ORGANISM="Symbiodinium sp., Strain CCMP421" /LENGTH=410 /DNA_ID=CAMNT_0023591797 /DNA_START=135 /DNA_END=1367 /DNA_ORIENTATION=+